MDAVLHLAAAVSMDTRWQKRDALEVNVKGTWHVLEAMRQEGVGRIVYASSNHATGAWELEGIPCDSGTPLRAGTATTARQRRSARSWRACTSTSSRCPQSAFASGASGLSPKTNASSVPGFRRVTWHNSPRDPSTRPFDGARSTPYRATSGGIGTSTQRYRSWVTRRRMTRRPTHLASGQAETTRMTIAASMLLGTGRIRGGLPLSLIRRCAHAQ
ncbi:MAG: NAD-dependent epimerase/dehydratase family protein [Betaproteobacteria bacterium]|nr:NAD-dependent epimerase/dehydratase family protein [Betaproteobacteria bacterium]